MDYPSYRPSTRSQNLAAGSVVEGQAGIEERLSETRRYLQKQGSYNSLRYNDPSRVGLSQTSHVTSQGDSAGLGAGTKARKGSLRYAMRRIFGRRSKEQDPPPLHVSPPRHFAHKSETSALTTQELSPSRMRDDNLVKRTRSTPIAPVTDAQRTRSPYAMQFPHSARLKPLDLGNPFAPPRTQVRRRQTLPSVQISESDASAVLASVASSSNPRDQTAIGSPGILIPDVEFPASVNKREKRRSRSAGDLKSSPNGMGERPQNRVEEMRQWRDSLSVLRASGFRASSTSAQTPGDPERDKTPVPKAENLYDSARAKVTPAFQRDLSEVDVGSGSAFDTDLSRDLEDRVARLESGLQNFRGQLQQLSADRNRRTVLVGGVDSRPRAPSGGRTASILASDLHQDLEPSNYQYGYMQNIRPSTSRPRSRTPTRTDPSAVTTAFSFSELNPDDDPFVSPPMAATASSGLRSAAEPGTMPQYTFRSLYEMLMDERSARRKLETQMNSLRLEITELHRQVSLQSNVQSQRSSYYAPMDAMAGSSRLHALLRDTEPSPRSAARSQMQRDSERYSADQYGLVSRFSGSESEIEPQTPYDAYLTPQEEQGRFPFAEETRPRGAMF